MSVTFFLHLNETENDAFDLEKFNREMEKKYPGTNKEISNPKSFSYDICWENYSDFYQFTLRMDKKRCTFAIEYFNSNNRIWDYANFIMWLSKYFDKEKDFINIKGFLPLGSGQLIVFNENEARQVGYNAVIVVASKKYLTKKEILCLLKKKIK